MTGFYSQPAPLFPLPLVFMLGLLCGFMLAFPIIAFIVKARIIECICQWKDED